MPPPDILSLLDIHQYAMVMVRLCYQYIDIFLCLKIILQWFRDLGYNQELKYIDVLEG